MSASKHLRNLAFNWGGHSSTLLVMFFLSPYIVGKLDGVSYGIWSLLNVLTGYMGIFDLGVRASVGRHIALYLGKRDKQAVDETIRAGLGYFSLTGLLILIVGVLLGYFFPSVFKSVPEEFHNTVRLLLPFMVFNVWLSAISAIYSSVIVAHERFDIARSIDIAVLLIRSAGTVLTLHWGMGLWGLAGSLMVGNAFALGFNRFYSGRVNQGLQSFPFLYSRLRLRELFGYGVPAFITAASVRLIGQSDLVIVGIFLSVAEVREYSVGAMIVYYSVSFIALIGNNFFPAIQRTASGGTIGEVKYLFYNQLRITLCVGFLFYIGFVFYSKSFISLWMLQEGFDSKSVAAASLVMTILALSKVPTLYIQPCQNVLAALGYVGITAKATLVEALANLICSLLFIEIYKLGIAGVAAGTLVARILVPTFYIPYYACRKLNIKGRVFIKGTVLVGILCGGLFSLGCFLLLRFWTPDNWLVFALHMFIATAVWGIICLLVLLPKDVRRRIKKEIISKRALSEQIS